MSLCTMLGVVGFGRMLVKLGHSSVGTCYCRPWAVREGVVGCGAVEGRVVGGGPGGLGVELGVLVLVRGGGGTAGEKLWEFGCRQFPGRLSLAGCCFGDVSVCSFVVVLCVLSLLGLSHCWLVVGGC